MKLGIAQLASVEHRLDINVKKHLTILKSAKNKKCKYVIFPELSPTGYCLDQLAEYSPALIRTIASEFSTFAIKNEIGFTIGCPVWFEQKLHIGAITFLDDGSVVYHHKRKLLGNEASFVEPGCLSPQFEFDGKKFKLCIGDEIDSRCFFQAAQSEKTDIYCVSALITSSGFERESAILQKYAEQGISVLLANHSSYSEYSQCVGRSCYWNKQGHLSCEAGLGEHLLVVEH